MRLEPKYARRPYYELRKLAAKTMHRRGDLFVNTAKEQWALKREAGPAQKGARRMGRSPQNGGPSISQVLLDVVRAEPGLQSSDVATKARGRGLPTNSRDPQKIALTRLGQLIKAGYLTRNATGGIYPTEKAMLANGATAH
jgi:hypothetical protein